MDDQQWALMGDGRSWGHSLRRRGDGDDGVAADVPVEEILHIALFIRMENAGQFSY